MLLNQAKKMKLEKMEREKEQMMKKNNNFNITKNDIHLKDYSSLSNFYQEKSPNSEYKNKKIINDSFESNQNVGKDNEKREPNSIQSGTILPVIQSSKNKERIEKLKIKNEDNDKIGEINDMMKQIINEF